MLAEPTGLKVAELARALMTFGREAGEDASQAILSRYLDAGGETLSILPMATGSGPDCAGSACPQLGVEP